MKQAILIVFLALAAIFPLFSEEKPTPASTGSVQNNAYEQSPLLGDTELEFSGSFGILGPGPVFISGNRVDSNPALLARFQLDKYFMADRIALGLFYNQSAPSIGADGKGGSISMNDLGLAFKLRWDVASWLMLKPGLGLAYRLGTVRSNLLSDPSSSFASGLGLNFGLEVKPLGLKIYELSPYFDFGVISQPLGSHGQDSVTYGPMFYFAAGFYYL